MKQLLLLAFTFICSHSFAQSKSITSIPLIQKGNYIFITIAVNENDSLNFMFDSGAEFTVVNGDNKAIVLKGGSRSMKIGGGTGNVKANLYKKQKVKIGSVVLDDVKILQIPFNHFYKAQGIKLDGIIGQDLMDKFIIENNIDKSIFALYDKQNFIPDPKADVLEILDVKGDKHGAIEVALTLKNGKNIKGKFVLDTGSGSCFSLNIPFAEENKILESMPVTYKKLSYGAASDELLSNNGRLASVQIGKYIFDNPTANVKETTKGTYMSTNRSGVIGNQVLSRFNTVYDFGGKKMYIVPSTKIKDPFIAQANGMSITYGDANFTNLVVRIVTEKSPAADAGIKVGDEIITVNGVNAITMGLYKLLEIINVPGQKIAMTLKQSDGSEKKVNFVTRDIIL